MPRSVNMTIASGWTIGRVIDQKPWIKKSLSLRMKPPNGWRYRMVEVPGLIRLEDAVG